MDVNGVDLMVRRIRSFPGKDLESVKGWNPKSWRFGSDDFPYFHFQLGDF